MKRLAFPCTALALFGAVALFNAAESTAANSADEPTINVVTHNELGPLAKATANNQQLKCPDDLWTRLAVGELVKTAACEETNPAPASMRGCAHCHRR
jgi:hypothetical protein